MNCLSIWISYAQRFSARESRVFIILLIFLVGLSPLLASANVEQIGISLSGVIELYVDEAPFTLPEELENQQFKSFEQRNRLSYFKNTVNTRYWIKIPPRCDLNLGNSKGYYYFGDFNRILVFQKQNGSTKNLINLGFLYKDSIMQVSPHTLLLPIDLLDPDEETYVQLSSGFHVNVPLETIKPNFIPFDNIRNLRFRSSFDKTKGIVQLGLLFYLALIILICICYNIIFSTKKLLSFTLVICSFFAFSLRHVEGSFMTIVFWGHFNEGVLRFEVLSRVIIAASFTLFALLNFQTGKYKRILWMSSIFTITFGMIAATYNAILIGPFNHSTSLMRVLYFMEITFTFLNSTSILYLIWKNDTNKFGKAFVKMTMFYIIISYCGLWLNTTWLGQLDNFFSSKMYSIYSIFIYLSVLAFLAIRDLKSRESSYQNERIENKRLNSLQQSRAKLYSDISHEIRSPLTIIQAALDNSETTIGKKELIRKNSNELLKLADHIRNLSSIGEKQMYQNHVSDDFVAYVKYLIESFESVACQKNIELNFYSSHEQYFMDYEQEGIRQIVFNLISNAIAFSKENGIIEVSLDFSNNNCEWIILDSGEGIPLQNIDHIFDRHFTDHSLVVDKYTGTGIGLSLINEIVNRLDGTIICHSEVDIGTLFKINFPVISNGKINEEDILGQRQTDNEQKSYYSTDDTIILVVEDNQDVRNYINQTLNKHYRILVACDGDIAFELAKEHVPDLVISDIMMPRVNGFQLIELLKSDLKTDHIPLILLTGKSGQREKEKGLSYGADAFLTKPFSNNELLLTVSNILSRSETLRKKFASTPVKWRTEIPNWFKSLNKILKDQIADEISIEQMSRLLCMSRTQLHRKIKAITGLSTSQYIKNYKMTEAKNQLQFTDSIITDIAYNLGYKNPGHFATDFKKYVGKSPSEFRKHQQVN